ncbi:hypothetical protein HOY82DRAFT_627590 [Tuber indicum]|nr:hypothetical protein HOY82DRAFT_627590 [Tuber indicum]
MVCWYAFPPTDITISARGLLHYDSRKQCFLGANDISKSFNITTSRPSKTRISNSELILAMCSSTFEGLRYSLI